MPPEGPDKSWDAEAQSQVWADDLARAAAVSPALGVSEAVSPGGPGGSSLGGSRGGRLGEGSRGEEGLQGPPPPQSAGSVSPEDPGEGRTQASWAVGCCGGRSPASGGGGLAGLRRRSQTVRRAQLSAGEDRRPFGSEDTAIRLRRTRAPLPHPGLPARGFSRIDCLPGCSPPPASPPRWLQDPGAASSGVSSAGVPLLLLFLYSKGNRERRAA